MSWERRYERRHGREGWQRVGWCLRSGDWRLQRESGKEIGEREIIGNGGWERDG